MNAFHKTLPAVGFEDLSKRALAYAKGIPLALKVLGSLFYSKSENEWDSALRKLEKTPNRNIQQVLRLSYDELDDEEKNIFLDIACFFKGYARGRVTKILNACGFFADIGIRNLLDKALITISGYDCIHMHDLLQEMGKKIVREESDKITGRSRLWDSKEVWDLLTNNKRADEVEGILLDTTQVPHINLSSKAFKKMPNLRFLAFQGHHKDSKRTYNSLLLPRGLEALPNKLRYFEWDGCPLKSLPPSFCCENLVELSLRESNVEKLWHGVQNMPYLEKIDLEGCTHLKECPNLSGAPNLKTIGLTHCRSLLNVDESIFSLEKLEDLHVSGCISLKSLCSNTCPPSLRTLLAFGCLNLQKFSIPLPSNDRFISRFSLNLGASDNISLLSSLYVLCLYKCSFVSLPESIKYLPQLRRLQVFRCKMLRSIPGDCINLDEHSCHTILKDANVRVESRAKPHSTIALQDDNDLHLFEI
ncbi:hypothetical protein RJT34_17237 [Clitoria ternatea]|uniref:Disease resistance protein Roq1-like winged-helix domain-containing protein n=1 Tax=Clitoria ternatea TaxID=43366 RepID=A0AAN9PD17_CLITE